MTKTVVTADENSSLQNVQGVKRVSNHMRFMPPEVQFGI